MSIDQVVFLWSRRSLTGRIGVGPVASSLPQRELVSWEERLQPNVWASRRELPAKEADLLYLVYGPQAVVMHRLSVADEHGRAGSTVTHCLIGAARELGPLIAAGLYDWNGWCRDPQPLPASGELDRIDLRQLGDAARRGLANARTVLAGLPRAELTAVVAARLADPGARLAVIDPDLPATVLIAGTVAVTTDVLAEPVTFSTGQDKDPGPEQPRVVVAGARMAADLNGAGFRRVPPSGDAEMDQLAATMVAAYLDASSERLSELRPVRPLRSAQEVGPWLSQLRLAPNVFGRADAVVRRMVAGRLSSAEADYLKSVSGRQATRHELTRATTTELAEWATQNLLSGGDHETLALLRSELVERLFAGVAARQRVDDVADALTTAETEHSLIQDRLDRALRQLPERADMPAIIDLLHAASLAGLSRGELYEQTRAMLHGHDPVELLRAVQAYSDLNPTLTWLLLNIALDQATSRRDEKGMQRLLQQFDWFMTVVSAVEPDSELRACRLYHQLLSRAFGGRIRQRSQMVQILNEVPPHRPAPFLAALYYSAEGDVQRTVHEALARAYLRERGLSGVSPDDLAGRRPTERKPSPVPVHPGEPALYRPSENRP
ncbi:hypothetical protein ACWEOZ_12275 [Actinoplanes sp. NPDC004185]